MSSLQRYKKSGGFFQLLSLIETFGPQKKEKFLEMIDSESHVWAQALREKMLSLERIFGWPDQVVIEVFKNLPHKSQAFALTGMKDEWKAKISPFLTAADQRRFSDVLSESQPKPDEVQATLVKMVELARKMVTDRQLQPDKFDQGLVIPEGFEAKLEEQGAAALVNNLVGEKKDSDEPAVLTFNVPNAGAGGGGAEVIQLQRTLAAASKEIKALKEENRVMREKLEQIKRIA